MNAKHLISINLINAIDKMAEDGIIEDGPDTQADIIDGVCMALCSLLATADVKRDPALLYFNEMYSKIYEFRKEINNG